MSLYVDLNILDEKGIDISKLPFSTKIKLKTTRSKYIIELQDRHAFITGGTKLDGSVRYSGPQKIYIHGSSFGTALLKPLWICHNMRLEFTEDNSDRVTITSPIVDLTIEAGDASWQYAMDWEKVQTI